MKIGILTFHASHNCGSMLQAYALQKTLELKFKQNAEIINFSNRGSRNLYGLFDLRLKRSAVEKNIKTIQNLSIIRKYRHDYMNFEKKYLKTSVKKYNSAKKMVGIEKNYDMLLAGGDQVWNLCCPDADNVYYLGFANNVKKVAFSPSFGGKNINRVAENKNQYRDYLNDFEYLSVREPNGQKWIKELTGKDVPIIADPTLLFTKEEWLELFDIPKLDEKFIFNYAFFHNRPEANEAIQKISQQTGMPVYILDSKSWAYYKLSKYGIKKYHMTGPIAFLTLISNAELVLTQSFHGTLFSALFQRKFWSYHAPIIDRNEDDRAISILKQLGLENRYVEIDKLADMDYMAEIEYKNTDNLIKNMRDKACHFIQNFLTQNMER